MNKYDVKDAVNFALGAKPVEFDSAIKSILGDKVVAAIDNKKEEVGQAMFSTDEEPAQNPSEEEAPSEE